MKKTKIAATLCLGVGGFMSVAVTAVPIEDPSYYVRPGLRVGVGQLLDGYEANVITSKTLSQGQTGYSESSVDLSAGTVKMYLEETDNVPVALQAFGGFGERIDIRGGAGTTYDIEFGIEGFIEGEMGIFIDDGGSRPATFAYNVGLVVHQAGVATGLNFLGIANDPCWGQDPLNCTPAPDALANEFYQGLFEIPVIARNNGEYFGDYFFEEVFESVTASIQLMGNLEQFDVFAYTNIFLGNDTVGANNGLASYVMDFSNTVTFSQAVAPGVDIYSSSGEFLGLERAPIIDPVDPPTSVPVPATLALFGLGLAGLGWSRRRQSS